MTLQRYIAYGLRPVLQKHEKGHWVEYSDAEAALAEKDAEIAALKATIEKMKCCENCKHIENGSPACYVCDEAVAENWEARDE